MPDCGIDGREFNSLKLSGIILLDHSISILNDVSQNHKICEVIFLNWNQIELGMSWKNESYLKNFKIFPTWRFKARNV